MTAATAALERIAAKAPPQTESIATRLVGATGGLGDRPDPEAVERASGAIALLERGAGLHAELLDPGTAHRPGRPDRDPASSALAGAWLIGRGAEAIAECGDQAAAQWAGAARELVGARMLEFEDLYDAGRSPSRRLAVAEARTGALLALGGRLGATLSGAGRAAIGAVSRFGRRLGVAVEIGEEIGSTALASGRYPLALSYALETDPDLATRLGRPLSSDQATQVLEAIEAAGGFERARQERGRRLADARGALEGLRADPLLALADEVA